MTIEEFTASCRRTTHAHEIHLDEKMTALAEGLSGLASESGEALNVFRKFAHQGHELNRAAIIDELGDILWYVVRTADALDVTLADIFTINARKLKKRFPEGFSAECSITRTS